MSRDILIEFGKRVQRLRRERQWSQEELADRSGFHRTYIGFIERGERNISLKAINTLCQTFGIPITEIFKNL